MKVTLLGTGTPMSADRFQSSALVEVGPDLLLFDAGPGAVHQLLQAEVDMSRIGPVFITHHHFDHIGSLFDVIIATAWKGREKTLHIYGPVGTHQIVDALLNGVYANDIRWRVEDDHAMRSHTGKTIFRRVESIRDVEVHETGSCVAAEGDGWRVISDFVLHGSFPNAPDFDWQSLGYRIESQNEVVTISGDTVPCPGIIGLAREADLLVQCCSMVESAMANPISRYFTESILPSTTQVVQIAADANVKRMVLTHLGPLIRHDNVSEVLADVRQNYQGEVLLGEDLLVIK